MAITLGTLPRQTTYDAEMVAAGTILTPAFGGPRQSINRLGDHWAITVNVPSHRAGACGDDMVTDLLRGRSETVIMPIPEPGVPVKSYGSPLVDGAGQLGSSLPVDGLTPGVVIPKSKWFTVTVSGQLYLYRTTAEVTADGSGDADLPIWPMIRRAPANNAAVNLASPKIEGFVQLDPWSIRRIGSVGFSFRIEETE